MGTEEVASGILKTKLYAPRLPVRGVERVFKRLNGYLREEFEVEPSPETLELYHNLRGD